MPPRHEFYYPYLRSELQEHVVLKIYDCVRKTALPNYRQARIPIPTALNIPVWKHYLSSLPHDQYIIDYLEFGFPLNYQSETLPQTEFINHPSAVNFPDHVNKHIETEIHHQAMLGPFHEKPFVQWSHVSPLMTRDKKGSKSRRIITDMSWPIGSSVNYGIPRTHYQGQPTKTTLPTLQSLLHKICQYGQFARNVEL